MDKPVPRRADAVPACEVDRLRPEGAGSRGRGHASIRAINPDLVLVVTRSADAIKLVRDMVRQRFEPKAIISPGSPGLYDEEFYQALGPLSDYADLQSALGEPEVEDDRSAGRGVQGGASRTIASRSIASMSASPSKRCSSPPTGSSAPALRHGPELMEAIRTTDIAEHVMIGGPIKFDDKGQNNNIGPRSSRTATVRRPWCCPSPLRP